MSPEDVGLKASPLASKEPCQRVREAEPLAPEAQPEGLGGIWTTLGMSHGEGRAAVGGRDGWEDGKLWGVGRQGRRQSTWEVIKEK